MNSGYNPHYEIYSIVQLFIIIYSLVIKRIRDYCDVEMRRG